jgi:hypothetical protein
MAYEQLSPETILSEWRRMGMTTLEELAARAAEISPTVEPRPKSVPFGLDDMLGETPTEVARTLIHREVEWTVIVDGSEVDDLREYDGRPLYFVVSRDTMERGPLIAYSRLDEVKTYIRRSLRIRDEEGLVGSSNPSIYTPDCYFYDDAGQQGNVKSLRPGFWFPDLTKVIRNVFWQDWNDVISSVAQSSSLRVVWEDVQSEDGPSVGQILVLDPGVGGNLGPIGWNDRISAISCGS